VLIEFVRGWGELSFPWNYLGYVFVPILALAQLSSVCGVLGLSFIAIAGNILVWELLRSYLRGADISQKWLHIAVFAAFLAVSAGWGLLRLSRALPDAPAVTVSLVQANMDQARWGDGSLDTCMDISGAMVYEAAKQRPDLIILAESALFCYLVHRPWIVGQVRSWSDSTHSPIITGSLHWDRTRDRRGNFEYAVYNTAFFIDTGGREFEPYFKIRLLPFSEAMPFETQLPLLNRLNLGEADFSRGSEEKVFRIGRDIRAGPFICFEIVFPDFVRRRVLKGANLLVNITNDGWWGRSNGPYHHASMARMRCIENGVPLARCANSGVSMAVDQYGRVLGRTRLGERTVLTRSVSLASVPTVYRRFGDWVLLVALFFVAEAVMVAAVQFFFFRRSRKASLSSKQEGGTGSPQ
jgi:apolipoprotein N-acyltransferase